jgi:hypothetical protein
MKEGLVFDIETADNAAAITEGFTVRVALNQRCNSAQRADQPGQPADQRRRLRSDQRRCRALSVPEHP